MVAEGVMVLSQRVQFSQHRVELVLKATDSLVERRRHCHIARSSRSSWTKARAAGAEAAAEATAAKAAACASTEAAATGSESTSAKAASAWPRAIGLTITGARLRPARARAVPIARAIWRPTTPTWSSRRRAIIIRLRGKDVRIIGLLRPSR
jgi:hypothetical protein